MASNRRRRPNEAIIRLPRSREVSPVVGEAAPLRRPRQLFGVSTILLSGFALLILAGGGLLILPIASQSGEFTPPTTAFFTSISAVTVTGHIVVSTPDYWTPFGQAVIFVLMTVGGLGFMVLSTFLLLLIGSRATLQERILTYGFMRDTVGVEQMQGLRRIGRQVLLLVFSLYILGAIILFSQINGLDGVGPLRSFWHSLFLSVSSFNNAGFNIIPEVPAGNAARFVSNFAVLIPMTVLMVLGGLGWVIIVDVWRHRRFGRFSLDTKLVVVTSLGLWVLGAAVLLSAEVQNADTMGALSWPQRAVGVVFQSVSGRTAGFSIIDFGYAEEVTRMAFSALMFIGGAAGSVAGGIKVVTFAVIVAAVVSSLRGRVHAEAFGREIPQSQLHRALTVAVMGVGCLVIAVPVVASIESDIPFLHLLFDTVSALGTTGASTGIVPDLGITGKVVFMIAMFVGRLGPVTLALALAPQQDETELYRFAQERVRIG